MLFSFKKIIGIALGITLGMTAEAQNPTSPIYLDAPRPSRRSEQFLLRTDSAYHVYPLADLRAVQAQYEAINRRLLDSMQLLERQGTHFAQGFLASEWSDLLTRQWVIRVDTVVSAPGQERLAMAQLCGTMDAYPAHIHRFAPRATPLPDSSLRVPLAAAVGRRTTDVWAYPAHYRDSTWLLLTIRKGRLDYLTKLYMPYEIAAYEDRISGKPMKGRSGGHFGRMGDGGYGQGRNPSPATTNGASGSPLSMSVSGPLAHRKVLQRPRMEPPPSDAMGRVIVKICVSEAGEVTSAEYVERGSTTQNPELRQRALDAARKYKFEPAPEANCGLVTFNFQKK
jgi:TonB family protein